MGDLYRHFPQRVVIEPQLLQVGQFPYLGAKLDYVVEGQVQTREITHLEHLRREGIITTMMVIPQEALSSSSAGSGAKH